MLAVALFLAAGCFDDPCAALPPLPSSVDVGLSAAGGGIGAELTVISIAELGAFVLSFAQVSPDPWGLPLVLAGIGLAWPIGAVAAASERADLRGASPLWTGVATGVPAVVASGVATAFFYASTTARSDAEHGSDVLLGLGVLAGGALVQGVAAGVTTAFTGGD